MQAWAYLRRHRAHPAQQPRLQRSKDTSVSDVRLGWKRGVGGRMKGRSAIAALALLLPVRPLPVVAA